MKSEEFIEAVKDVVKNAAIEDVKSNLESPPGRRVSKTESECSEWYNRLKEDEKGNVNAVIESAVNEAIFGLLAVLDGVRPICSAHNTNKGELVLIYRDQQGESVLNAPDKIGLHDLYNS
tara:strand:+ start:585 stop:944 length:360 start_codon:yes stop_codon:yes gene_type:complete